MKLLKLEKAHPTDPDYIFDCPGCECSHGVWTTNPSGPNWKFDGNIQKPTFTPSLKIQWGDKNGPIICHLNITNGKLLYHRDTTHKLSGLTIEMPEFEFPNY